MANVKLNALIDGVSGKVGKNIVLRQRGGRTMMGSRPAPSLTLTDKQKSQRERFRQAARYAKTALLVPSVKSEYEALAKVDDFFTPYSVAVTDFLTSPEVSQIDATGFTGVAGDKIVIRSATDYKVTSIKVSVQNADGTEIENGDAVSNHPTRLEWTFITTQNVASLPGTRIVVTAQDRPGRTTTSEKVLI